MLGLYVCGSYANHGTVRIRSFSRSWDVHPLPHLEYENAGAPWHTTCNRGGPLSMTIAHHAGWHIRGMHRDQSKKSLLCNAGSEKRECVFQKVSHRSANTGRVGTLNARDVQVDTR